LFLDSIGTLPIHDAQMTTSERSREEIAADLRRGEVEHAREMDKIADLRRWMDALEARVRSEVGGCQWSLSVVICWVMVLLVGGHDRSIADS
jgi:hypothetical protein